MLRALACRHYHDAQVKRLQISLNNSRQIYSMASGHPFEGHPRGIGGGRFRTQLDWLIRHSPGNHD